MAGKSGKNTKAAKSAEPVSGASTKRGKQRSEEMVRVAAELFLQHGYEGTSVDEVIQQAGGSKTHVYREFGDKQGLFLACVRYLCDEVQHSIEGTAVAGLTIREGLQRLSYALVTMLMGARHLAVQRMIYAEAMQFREAGLIWFERGPTASYRTFGAYFTRSMKAGLLRKGDADMLARLFCDMLAGHLLDRAWLGIEKRPSLAEAKRTVDVAIEVFLRGYGAE